MVTGSRPDSFIGGTAGKGSAVCEEAVEGEIDMAARNGNGRPAHRGRLGRVSAVVKTTQAWQRLDLGTVATLLGMPRL